MSNKAERQLKELRRLMPWNWDARVEEHPPGEKAMHDFENILTYQLDQRRRRTTRPPSPHKPAKQAKHHPRPSPSSPPPPAPPVNDKTQGNDECLGVDTQKKQVTTNEDREKVEEPGHNDVAPEYENKDSMHADDGAEAATVEAKGEEGKEEELTVVTATATATPANRAFTTPAVPRKMSLLSRATPPTAMTIGTASAPAVAVADAQFQPTPLPTPASYRRTTYQAHQPPLRQPLPPRTVFGKQPPPPQSTGGADTGQEVSLDRVGGDSIVALRNDGEHVDMDTIQTTHAKAAPAEAENTRAKEDIRTPEVVVPKQEPMAPPPCPITTTATTSPIPYRQGPPHPPASRFSMPPAKKTTTTLPVHPHPSLQRPPTCPPLFKPPSGNGVGRKKNKKVGGNPSTRPPAPHPHPQPPPPPSSQKIAQAAASGSKHFDREKGLLALLSAATTGPTTTTTARQFFPNANASIAPAAIAATAVAAKTYEVPQPQAQAQAPPPAIPTLTTLQWALHQLQYQRQWQQQQQYQQQHQ